MQRMFKFRMRLPRDRMRSGVPLVVSLRRSPEGSILKAVQYPRGFWSAEGDSLLRHRNPLLLRFIA